MERHRLCRRLQLNGGDMHIARHAGSTFDGKQRARGAPLAAALVVAGAASLAPQAAAAAITAVGNCNDGGSGSLRSAVAAAASGDTIDLGGLPCATITLTTGAITIGIDNLTVRGAGDGATFIDGNDHSRVFVHTGTGTLRIDDLTVRRGTNAPGSGDAVGGCIYSKGSVRLSHARVEYCIAQAQEAIARGAGICAQNDVLVYFSSVAHNQAVASGSGAFTAAFGAGVYARKALVAKYSTIADNAADGPHAIVGGVAASGNVTITHSTISGNSAVRVVGGAYLTGNFATKPLRISNSTISGNTASDSLYGAGLAVAYPLVLSNSTISANIEANGAHEAHGAGLFVKGLVAIEIESSIIGGNFLAGGFGTPSDFGGTDANLQASGGDNLVTRAFVGVPGDTIGTHQPRLEPLADNGGPTATHMPMPDSLAIDAGNNLLKSDADQRGAGYPRVFGTAPDIGAVEWNDRIFDDGFD
jgi:hypothetical protein